MPEHETYSLFLRELGNSFVPADHNPYEASILGRTFFFRQGKKYGNIQKTGIKPARLREKAGSGYRNRMYPNPIPKRLPDIFTLMVGIQYLK
jgi:hypothetical protein